MHACVCVCISTEKLLVRAYAGYAGSGGPTLLGGRGAGAGRRRGFASIYIYIYVTLTCDEQLPVNKTMNEHLATCLCCSWSVINHPREQSESVVIWP